MHLAARHNNPSKMLACMAENRYWHPLLFKKGFLSLNEKELDTEGINIEHVFPQKKGYIFHQDFLMTMMDLTTF